VLFILDGERSRNGEEERTEQFECILKIHRHESKTACKYSRTK
jgi:hypothetical protein